MDFDDLDVVFEDSDGNLWVGGAGGIDRFDRHTGTFSRIDERGQVFCITEDKDGTLWVGFWHGLYGYDRQTHEMLYAFPRSSGETDSSKTLTNGQVKSIIEDAQGYLWIGTSAGLDRLDRKAGTFTHYHSDPNDPQSLSHNSILAILEDRQGILWVGTDGGGLNRLDRTTGIFRQYRHDPDDPHSIGSDFVLSISDDNTGNLWVGTSEGLNLFDPDRNQFILYQHDAQKPYSVSDSIIFSLFEDRSDVLWIGTANGVSKMVPRMNQFVDLSDMLDIPSYKSGTSRDSTALEELTSNKVMVIYEDAEGYLWFGTRLGGLYRLNPNSGNVATYRHNPEDPESIISDQVYAIHQGSSGDIWVGTGNGWLERWVPQTESFTHEFSTGAPVRSISEDLSGDLWIGTQGEGLYRLDMELNVLIHYPFTDSAQWRGQNSLSSHIVETAIVDQAGVIWIGTYVGGLNSWEDGFSHFHHDPNDSSSLSHNYVLSLLEEDGSGSGVMWIGTMGGGLNRFDRETGIFTRFTIEDGLADNIVTCILADDFGRLWLGTPKGVTRFDPLSETFQNYDEHDGAGSGASHPGVCLLSESGDMYFGTPSNVFVFDPLRIHDNLDAPPIIITSFSVNNRVVQREIVSEYSIALSHDENNLSFEFSALDYTSPERNLYAYRMEGLDEDWIVAGTHRRADYPTMPPGSYTFRVRGSNNDGVWNEEGVAIAIKIDPPFWMEWWFLGLIGLITFGAIYGGYRFRLRSLEARSRDLENQIEERTQEINRRRLQTEALYRADEDLYRHLDLDQVLDALVTTTVQILGADKGALLCWDDRQEHLIIRAAHNYSADTMNNTRIARGQANVYWPVGSGEAMIVEDIEAIPHLALPIIEV